MSTQDNWFVSSTWVFMLAFEAVHRILSLLEILQDRVRNTEP